MGFRLNLSLLLAVLFGMATIAAGTAGWLLLSPQGQAALGQPTPIGWSEAIYRALQALTLSDAYTPLNFRHDPLLVATRFGGFLTTLSAVIALMIGTLGSRLSLLREGWRRDHVVVLGADGFVLSYLRNLHPDDSKSITAFIPPGDDPDLRDPDLRDPDLRISGLRISGLRDGDRRGLRILPMPQAGLPAIGRPAQVVFGDRNSIRNIENARRLLPQLGAARLTLRIEQAELTRIQAGLPPALLSANILSRNQITAEALIGALDLGGLAEIRGQSRPHLAIIGFGSCAVTIAEEVALRSHRPGQMRPMLSVFDCDALGAEQRMQQLCPGLPRALEIGFHGLDGLVCNTVQGLDTLTAVEGRLPFTAIIVSTGQDELNMAIALRLARVQQDHLRCKAPILVRNTNSDSISPAPLTGLTQGIALFGGERFDRRSLAIQRISERVARRVHEVWLAGLPEPDRKGQDWDQTSNRNRASSRRAVLSGLELLRATGLEAEPGQSYCGFRGFRPHLQARMTDAALIERLAIAEHDRWSAEKHADGFRHAGTGPRDNERKLHPLLVPYDRLGEADRQKDRDQVMAILQGAMTLYDRRPTAPCWRHRLRIGVIGALHPDSKVLAGLADIAAQLATAELPVPLAEAMLEIVTPNAPGFDRIAAAALLSHYSTLTRRRGDALLLQALRAPALDQLAADRVKANVAAAQSAALRDAAHLVRQVDLRPPGLSDTDITHQGLIQRQFDLAAAEVDRLSDLVIFGIGYGPAEHSAASLRRRRAQGRPCLVL